MEKEIQRKAYKTEEKMKLIEEYRAKPTNSASHFARTKGIPHKTFIGWLREDSKGTFDEIEANSYDSQKKKLRPSIFPEIEF